MRIKAKVMKVSRELKTAQTEGCCNLKPPYLSISVHEYVFNNISHLGQINRLEKWLQNAIVWSQSGALYE